METKLKTSDDIKESFDYVRSFLDGIGGINSGGCGVSALAMYRWLKKNHPEYIDKVTFHFFHRDKESFTNNKVLIENNSYNDAYLYVAAHIGIKIKGLTDIIDSYKNIMKKQYEYNLETDSELVLINMLNGGYQWNPYFNRKVNVPLIQKTLGIDLSDVVIDM